MKRYFLFISILISAVAWSVPATAQESKFKALFIYKFAEYIEWPSGSKNVTVGVVGKSDVMTELAAFATTKENLKVISIESPADVSKCNILFLPKTHDKLATDFRTAIGMSSVLYVSENSELTGKGADIGFFVEEGKLRFLISEKDIRAKKMVPSSKLLALGKAI